MCFQWLWTKGEILPGLIWVKIQDQLSCTKLLRSWKGRKFFHSELVIEPPDYKGFFRCFHKIQKQLYTFLNRGHWWYWKSNQDEIFLHWKWISWIIHYLKHNWIEANILSKIVEPQKLKVSCSQRMASPHFTSMIFI